MVGNILTGNSCRVTPGVGNAVLTMTSREIAQLTGKQHQHVLFDIRKMLVELDEDESFYRRIYLDTMNRQQSEFILNRELTDVLLTGYSAKLRRIVIARWHELEAKQAAPGELSRMDILTLAIESEKGRLAAVEQLAITGPKADALDRIAGTAGSITIREAAKDLQVKPLAFSNWLKVHRWIFKQGRNNLAYQPRIDAGFMEHKITLIEVEGDDGVTFEKPVTQARITPKGLAKLALALGGSAA